MEQKSKKRVMLMIPLLDQGGQERICALTANLLKDEAEVCLAVFSTKNMIYDVSAVELIDLNLPSRTGILAKVLNVYKRAAAIRRLKKKRDIQVTYSFGFTANLINVLTRRNGKAWIGIRGYGALSDEKGMKITCKRADKVICCTQIMKEELESKYHPREVDYLYNPCDREAIRQLALAPIAKEHAPFFSGQTKFVVSMGREDDVKGFWHLIKAFALAKKELPKLKLVIIGEGKFTEYRELGRGLGVEDSILFTGMQRNPFPYMQKADLYVMTSITEGFPNALVEAMTLGLPILSTNCKTGPAEILTGDYGHAMKEDGIYVGEYGILFPAVCPNKNLDPAITEYEEKIMAEEMIRILSDDALQKKMGEKAEYRSRSFAMNVYKELLLQKISVV